MPHRVRHVLAATCSLAASLAACWFVLSRAGIGLGLGDEGYYLNTIARPGNFPRTVTLFGFAYHPLWVLAHRDVHALRIVTQIVTLALGWGLGVAALSRSRGRRPRGFELVLGLAIGTTTVALLQLWVLTPSYNTLALQGLLLVATGLVLAPRELPGPWLAAGALAGSGVVVAFAGKPTSGAAAGLLVTVVLFAPRSRAARRTGMAAVAGAAALAVVVVALLHHHDVSLLAGARDARALSSYHGIDKLLRIDRLLWTRSTAIGAFGLLVMSALGTWVLLARTADGRVVGRVLAVVLPVATLGVAITGAAYRPFDPFQGLWTMAIPLGAALVLARARRSSRSQDAAPQRSLVATLALLPLVFALGTSNDYWNVASQVPIFWLVAVVLLVPPTSGGDGDVRDRVVWSVVLATQLAAVIVAAGGATRPYGQSTALADMHSRMRVGHAGSLRVSADERQQVEAIRGIAREGRMPAGQAVLDLTGRFPGIVYALDAVPVGSAWLLGGYAGSADVASDVLARVPCATLARAWMLRDDPARDRSIPDAVLADRGLDPVTDWKLVGKYRVHAGARIQLLRPRPAARQACHPRH